MRHPEDCKKATQQLSDTRSNEYLHALCKEGKLDLALHVLGRTQASPPTQVYMSLLKTCIKKKSITRARFVYSHLAQHHPHPTGLLGDYLVSTLARCGAVDEALHVSNRLPRRSVFCWTAMISSYAECGRDEEALALHQSMKEDGVEPNQHTFASLFKACGSIPATQDGKNLHALAERKGFVSDAFVGTALVNMYSKFGDIVQAEDVFGKMKQRDIISWTAMLTAYVDHDQGEKALQLYSQMRAQGIVPDDRVLVILIQACGSLADKEETSYVDGRPSKVMPLEIGRSLHADVRSHGYASNVYVGTTLVSMYGKCGALEDAEDAFKMLSQRNIVTWNAMLSAYVEQRLAEKALNMYWSMQKEDVFVNDITMICALQACHETGSLGACRHLHFHIAAVGYDQNHSIASTLIHGYGSCGSTEDGEAVFNALLAPDVVSWTTCIAGLTGDGDCGASLDMFEVSRIAGVQPNEVTISSVLAACCHAGLVDEGLSFYNFISLEASLTPELKHFSCMMDLLGRAGNFKRLTVALRKMPMEADLTFWLCLLSACRMHGNVELAKQAFDCAMLLRPDYPALYVSLSNIYMDAGLEELATQLRNSMGLLDMEDAWELE